MVSCISCEVKPTCRLEIKTTDVQGTPVLQIFHICQHHFNPIIERLRKENGWIIEYTSDKKAFVTGIVFPIKRYF